MEKSLAVIEWQHFESSANNWFSALVKKSLFSAFWKFPEKCLTFTGLWCLTLIDLHRLMRCKRKDNVHTYRLVLILVQIVLWIRLQWPLEKADSSYHPSNYSFLFWVIKLSFTDATKWANRHMNSKKGRAWPWKMSRTWSYLAPWQGRSVGRSCRPSSGGGGGHTGSRRGLLETAQVVEHSSPSAHRHDGFLRKFNRST